VPGLVEQLAFCSETGDSQTDGGEDGSMAWLSRELSPIPEVGALIESAIAPEPAGAVGEGNVIREGFSPELDELKRASRDARGYIAGLEQKERERTGLRGLKVGYNQVFGYYIEVSKANVDQVPEEYIRRQTLVNSERYIVPELKEYESLVLNARERLDELEKTLYRQVCRQISESGAAISRLAAAIAQLDVFVSLGEVAVRNGYVRPHLDLGDVIEIEDGRHPVVEGVLAPGGYVPNDVYLSNGDAKIIVLTGPNMAGKSTFIRQAAIITLMAQIGSFVPASQAVIGLVDRIFTRVGLQDDLTTGQSTFMVEMVETAAILNQATPRSLVVLDEIGRGTSTYDGMSIAQSVIEHLHNDPRLGCKTLFATHYHELTQLASTLPGVRNFTVAVAEEDGDVVFLHRIAPGGADKSYGVHVARLAGLPNGVVNRAWEVLADLEGSNNKDGHPANRKTRRREQDLQMQLFNPAQALADEVKALDIPNLTPLEAINRLYELQQKALSPEGPV
jgi:DNA mismatch repair protein MutS